MSEFPVAREAAEDDFARWVSSMGLVDKLSDESLDADDKKNLTQAKSVLLRAIERGHLVVNQDGEFEYTPQIGEKEPLQFPEPDGAALMAIESVKETEPIKRTFALLAAVTGQNRNRFAKMKNRDLDVCKNIVALFLGG
jgi:hypothetical protein